MDTTNDTSSVVLLDPSLWADQIFPRGCNGLPWDDTIYQCTLKRSPYHAHKCSRENWPNLHDQCSLAKIYHSKRSILLPMCLHSHQKYVLSFPFHLSPYWVPSGPNCYNSWCCFSDLQPNSTIVCLKLPLWWSVLTPVLVCVHRLAVFGNHQHPGGKSQSQLLDLCIKTLNEGQHQSLANLANKTNTTGHLANKSF